MSRTENNPEVTRLTSETLMRVTRPGAPSARSFVRLLDRISVLEHAYPQKPAGLACALSRSLPGPEREVT